MRPSPRRAAAPERPSASAAPLPPQRRSFDKLSPKAPAQGGAGAFGLLLRRAFPQGGIPEKCPYATGIPFWRAERIMYTCSADLPSEASESEMERVVKNSVEKCKISDISSENAVEKSVENVNNKV